MNKQMPLIAFPLLAVHMHTVCCIHTHTYAHPRTCTHSFDHINLLTGLGPYYAARPGWTSTVRWAEQAPSEFDEVHLLLLQTTSNPPVATFNYFGPHRTILMGALNRAVRQHSLTLMPVLQKHLISEFNSITYEMAVVPMCICNACYSPCTGGNYKIHIVSIHI